MAYKFQFTLLRNKNNSAKLRAEFLKTRVYVKGITSYKSLKIITFLILGDISNKNILYHSNRFLLNL